jgi:C-terminal peptidase prc
LPLAALAAVAFAQAEPPARNSPPDRAARIKAAARQAWAITDIVLEQDLDPPARQQMLLHGVRALLRDTSGRTLDNLPARVSTVTTTQQFADLLADIWPTDGEGLEETLCRGLFAGRRDEEPESGYLSPQALEIHGVQTGNRYIGTGIQIRTNAEEKLPQIVIPIAGGPARRAGARPGDLIVTVDGKSMEGLSLRDVVKRLQGEDGTKVTMTVRQPGDKKTRLLPLVRSVVPFASVHGYRRTGEDSWSFKITPGSAVGYLSLDDVKSSTPLELRKIEPLVQADGVRALVLDLRFARGSDLRHAALVADALLDGGLLWRVREGRGRVKEYRADRDCLFRDVRMAVLVNEHTSGVAVAVAAALQDRGRAVLVGEPSRSHRFVTSLVSLPEGQGGLLLRTGILERVGRAGKGAQGRVVPEEHVPVGRKAVADVLEWRRLQESPEPKADAKPPADPQLDRAVALLQKALARQEKKADRTDGSAAGRKPG